jgi:outer membrane protein TolC
MRMPARILAVMAATLLMAPAIPQDRVNLSRKERIEKSAKKVKELQRERIATLKQMVDVNSRLEERGMVSLEEALEARVLLLNAELDAAEKESDRVTLYKKIVDVLKGYEKFAEERVKNAGGTPVPILKVKARRLEAEIHLEQEKAKEDKEAK